MTEPEAAPAPRWPWLDRWLEPPWRALVTWMALATMSVAAEGLLWREQGLETISRLPAGILYRLMPFASPSAVKDVVLTGNACMLLIWFEPVVLRLSVLRSVAWLGLRIPVFTFASILPLLGGHSANRWDLFTEVLLVTAAIQPLALWRWRSRPWMTVASAALIIAIGDFTHFIPYWGNRWDQVVLSFFYAAPLLYGTRLLRPEERVRDAT